MFFGYIRIKSPYVGSLLLTRRRRAVFPYFNPWEAGISAWRAFLETFKKTTDEQRMEKEAKIQLKLASPPAPSGQARFVTRLVHNAAPLRAYLDHHRELTALSEHPLVEAIQTVEARSFIVDFHQVERSLQHQMGVSHGNWQAPGSYRDGLSDLLRQNASLYQQVAGWNKASPAERSEVMNRLARELQAGQRASAPTSIQMQ